MTAFFYKVGTGSSREFWKRTEN